MIAPKTGRILIDRPKVEYQSGKDNSNLATIDERREWGRRYLEKWVEKRAGNPQPIKQEKQ